MLYCETCGGRDVCCDATHYPNNKPEDQWSTCGDDWYCGDCGETRVTEDREDAAHARLSERKRRAAGCICGASAIPDPRAVHPSWILDRHADHCPAAAPPIAGADPSCGLCKGRGRVALHVGPGIPGAGAFARFDVCPCVRKAVAS